MARVNLRATILKVANSIPQVLDWQIYLQQYLTW